MISILPPLGLLLLAAAFQLTPPGPWHRGREGWRGPKHPRDGPEGNTTTALPGWLNSRLDRARGSPKVDRLGVAADISLFAACLRAGLSTGQAASAVAAAAAADTAGHWTSVAALLQVGVDPARAWSAMNDIPGLSELAGLARMSQRSGAAVAEGCERIAETLRSEASDAAQAAAERAGVFIALPLAMCFLPGFIILGLAPVVIGLGTQILNP
ncbi:Bacterial type II secretion system protein F domain protein [Corynebacterium occultum]|uniref:Bacterial type II secretion system protein F domain protein n=1 Tax=Corynebacterium occultum TaxID=2675219 RepID=A0A6B8VQ93_9CORY|nr:type II secretion system F family protein [Corynebacterium occultum]QGU06283.1 Bacterial type II secretion system protein F domain protein [Corynebacterium occultum]